MLLLMMLLVMEKELKSDIIASRRESAGITETVVIISDGYKNPFDRMVTEEVSLTALGTFSVC